MKDDDAFGNHKGMCPECGRYMLVIVDGRKECLSCKFSEKKEEKKANSWKHFMEDLA